MYDSSDNVSDCERRLLLMLTSSLVSMMIYLKFMTKFSNGMISWHFESANNFVALCDSNTLCKVETDWSEFLLFKLEVDMGV